MYALDIGLWIPAIALIPLLGALLNAALGKRCGKAFVTFVGVLAPAASFFIALGLFGGGLLYSDRSVVVSGAPEDLALVEQQLRARSGTPADVALVAESTGSAQKLEILPEPHPPADPTHLRIRGLEGPDDPRLRLATGGLDVRVGKASVLAPRVYQGDLGSWISVGDLDLRFRFLLDRLAIILVLVITGVGTLIHIYSTSYMEGEDAGGFARYFTYLNMFVGSMLILVLGSDLLLMFVGWEGVGLCSYLLIGFEYRKPDFAACGSKAFIVNRIGDVGFVLGMLTLAAAVRVAQGPGQPFNLDMATINDLSAHGAIHSSLLGVAAIFLFIGATGKSAQIPLHIWLPDAMAGPTPVSALIHAATMVTAGVYLIARLSPMFAEATLLGVPVLGLVAIVGVLTAFFAGTAALAQDDIKKVLAYSTISQLGYMFVGVGSLAMGAAVFHLVTHAFFKALLFLGAGAVIHATHTQNMRQMGGLKNHMPVTFVTMLIGALALGGFPLLSGFFSKDMILFGVLARASGHHAHWAWWGIYLLGTLTAFITALYSARLVFMTFFGRYRGEGHPHAAPPAMSFPLAILGVLALFGGVLGLPALGPLEQVGLALPNYLAPVIAETGSHLDHDLHVRLEITGLMIGMVMAVAGFGLGYVIWHDRSVQQIPWERPTGWMKRVREVLANAWYYDQAVNKQGVQPAIKYLSTVLWRWIDDATIDQGLVDGTGRVGQELSTFTRATQTGRLARYLGYFTIGAVVVPLLALFGPAVWQGLLSAMGGGH